MLIAIVITIIVILLQRYFYVKTKNDCKELSNLFPELTDESGNKTLKIQDLFIHSETNKYDNELNDEDTNTETHKKIKLIALNKPRRAEVSAGFWEILDSTNKYLKNNVDTTADFNILRDIAERISDSEESKIASTVSLPLYIGLMGTFIGVIFGILNIVFSGDGVGSSIITEVSIKAFLGGILIAMCGSLFGLIFTTINNSYFFKNSKAQRDKNKNSYLNFLQIELLPTLENTLGKNLREFKENLVTFNKEFSDNILDFKGTIPAITDNIKQQTEFIQEFKEIDIPRLAQANIKIFNKLNKSSELFKGFNEYAMSINNNLLKSDQILIKLTSLLDRMADFENNIKNIGVLVSKSDENYAKIGEYIVEKLSALKDRYQLIQEFVDKSEDEVKAISNNYIDRIQALSQSLEQQFDKAFNFTNVDSPFSRLQLLSKLELLESVNKNLMKISESLNQPKPPLPPKDDNNDLSLAVIQLIQSINSLKKSIRPSIFKPVQFFKFVFSRNGF